MNNEQRWMAIQMVAICLLIILEGVRLIWSLTVGKPEALGVSLHPANTLLMLGIFTELAIIRFRLGKHRPGS